MSELKGPTTGAASGASDQTPLSQPLSDFLATEIAPLRWVIPGLVPAGGLILLAGAQKLGKSTLAMDASVGIAARQTVLGRPTLGGPTLYVLEEGAPAGIADRFRRIVARRGMPADAHVMIRKGIRADEKRRWQRLLDEVEQLQPVLVVLDPLVRLHGSDEDRAHLMSPVMAALQQITTSGSAVIAVHHVAKHGKGEGAVGNAARGSGAIISATDGNLVLTRKNGHLRLESEMRDAEGEQLELVFDGATASFTLLDEPAPIEVARRYPGGVDPAVVVELAGERVARDSEGGLTATELAAIRHISSETARQALAELVHDGHLVKAGPANRPVYRPATPIQARAA